MREFTNEAGEAWTASVRERSGPDYKGRYFLWLEPRAEGARARGGEGVALPDVRWNSETTARRTLSTLSEVELRRRLRSALGRDTTAMGSLPEAS